MNPILFKNINFLKNQFEAIARTATDSILISNENSIITFAMFKRLHAHVEGSGIGLFTINRIIENAGVKIDVKSVLGDDSTFEVYLKR